jgi:membrane fusion protein, protease secretion system
MNIDTDYRRTLLWGVAILLLGFGGFAAWAVLAPLDEAVPAAGVVSVESKRKRVEHLTGGIVERILVREGERVREGQELVILNEVQSKAALNAALSQWRIAKATEARLQAERNSARRIAFPRELRDAAGEADVAAAMRAQEEVFRARRTALEGELRMIRESVRGLESQVASLETLRSGRETQVKLFNEQLDSYRTLKDQGFVSRNHLLEQERQLSEVQSKQSEDLSNIAGVKARLAEFRMRGSQREMEYRREVEGQLADVQKEAATLGERVAAQRDTHTRLAIRAPVAGTVVDLAVHTVDGVVKPGDRLMDIVPAADETIVEARVAPQYIDRVRPGLPADLHFDAYMSRVERPVVRGEVAVVSADALADARTGESFYAMRVAVPPEQRARLGELQLQPGMQTTVMVKTGERSLFVYLMRPLLRRFTGALSES